MPIYEFKCLKCNEFVEFIFVQKDDEVELKCPACGSFDLERVLSNTNYSMGTVAAGGSRPSTQTRSCPSGSCTTYDIPGPA